MIATVSPLTTAIAARRLSMSEGTIRYWVKTGRLRPVATTESGVRLFDPDEIDRLAKHLAAKRGSALLKTA